MIGREYLVSDAKCLKLDIPVDFTEMLLEAIALRSNFYQYQQGNDYRHQGWYSLPLYGLGDDKTLAWKGYGYTDGHIAARDMTWTRWAEYCPTTVKWLREIFPSNFYGRVRFMLLESGGFIAPHNDSEHSILEAVNVSLNNPNGCVWNWSDGTTLDFNPGDAYAMNLKYHHSINNNSDSDRYHLIVHHYDSTPEWKELMIRSMEQQNVQGNFLYSTELY